MKKILVLAAMAVTFVGFTSECVRADVVELAGWTFETSLPTTGGPHAAEEGLFAGTSLASSNSGGTFSNPAGNGSVESFSSNGWDVGEYFQFSTSTLGYQDITIEWDHTSSGTGPANFTLQYSLGIVWQDATSYSVTNDSWSTNPANFRPASRRSFSFSTVTDMNNVDTVLFRLTVANGTAVNGSPIAATGTSRVDNFFVRATAVPEPSALLLVGSVLGAGFLRRRRS